MTHTISYMVITMYWCCSNKYIQSFTSTKISLWCRV